MSKKFFNETLGFRCSLFFTREGAAVPEERPATSIGAKAHSGFYQLAQSCSGRIAARVSGHTPSHPPKRDS